mmetsp:Transcript_24544/g.34293  ORF Transcript_24544/g.34293 Transcript_24544/m.34293 type:complete len:152 (+) Transcript_24544:39-494(+)
MAALCFMIGACIVGIIPVFQFLLGGKGPKQMARSRTKTDACMCCEMLSRATELLHYENEEDTSAGENSHSFGVYSIQCPITREVMKDPVICSDGHTYERSAIQQWLQRHNTSPKTNLPLASNVLIPNHSLRSIIHDCTVRTLMRKEAKQCR